MKEPTWLRFANWMSENIILFYGSLAYILGGPERSQGVPGGGPGGVLGGYLGSFLWYIFLILFSFAGIFVSESKGFLKVFFKILIISFVLCVKARYAFCHVFVFFGTWIWTLWKTLYFLDGSNILACGPISGALRLQRAPRSFPSVFKKSLKYIGETLCFWKRRFCGVAVAAILFSDPKRVAFCLRGPPLGGPDLSNVHTV